MKIHKNKDDRDVITTWWLRKPENYNKLQQTGKQTNKQIEREKKKNRNRLCNKQTYICIVLTQGNEKSWKKIAVVSAKPLKTVKYLS